MTPRLPFYIEVDLSAQVDAWLEQDGRRLPLKRMFDDGDPAVLRGAPTRAEAEREFARHFGDVRAGASVVAARAAAVRVWRYSSRPHPATG